MKNYKNILNELMTLNLTHQQAIVNVLNYKGKSGRERKKSRVLVYRRVAPSG